MTEPFFRVLLGVSAGICRGLIGSGGGVIIVPALVFVCGLSQHQAQGPTLALEARHESVQCDVGKNFGHCSPADRDRNDLGHIRIRQRVTPQRRRNRPPICCNTYGSFQWEHALARMAR